MLTTLAKLKRVMQISAEDTSMDENLLLLIASASQSIENHCKRSFRKQRYTERMSGQSSLYLNLRNYPIHQVEEIRAGQILDSYEDIGDGRLYRKQGWPIGEHNISVTYTGGYVLPGDATESEPRTLPESIELACLLYIQMLGRNPGTKSERVGDISVTYSDDSQALPAPVSALLTPYVGRWV
ncbi:phage gp6-like head-tail connector protein [Brevibacillus parabrevis]|uniref:phage gp6-like head-tail connector protein n=1 Tax=Brevibacillus parabrevis TaxID=54914 RepID=UPI002852FBF2|nr:phage gp6-like head-tail connector protein [Brevibacillus parabrevis]MDR4997887.1 phage gp6-like head-tail connector protein [Brevibacillus parabrevis]